MQIELITVGNEILSGRTVDTNAAFLARALEAASVQVGWHGAVGDNAERIGEALRIALGRADAVVSQIAMPRATRGHASVEAFAGASRVVGRGRESGAAVPGTAKETSGGIGSQATRREYSWRRIVASTAERESVEADPHGRLSLRTGWPPHKPNSGDPCHLEQLLDPT